MTTNFNFGPQTSLIVDFCSLLSDLGRDEKISLCHRDSSRSPSFSAAGALWMPAYSAVLSALEADARAEFVGPAWLAAQRAVGVGPWAFAARPVVEALIVWDRLGVSDRATLWAPFAPLLSVPKPIREAA